MSEHDVSFGEDEIKAKRRTLRLQLKMIRDGHGAVFCGDCGTRVLLDHAFKCFYCHIWFCPACAKPHFATTPGSPCNSEELEFLKQEIKRLRLALATYATKKNWTRSDVGLNVFKLDTNGPYTAFVALAVSEVV